MESTGGSDVAVHSQPPEESGGAIPPSRSGLPIKFKLGLAMCFVPGSLAILLVILYPCPLTYTLMLPMVLGGLACGNFLCRRYFMGVFLTALALAVPIEVVLQKPSLGRTISWGAIACVFIRLIWILMTGSTLHRVLGLALVAVVGAAVVLFNFF
jgi:hypothetical protein